MESNIGFLDKRFKLKENKSDIRTEFLGGLTTFMAMSYILIVNPIILSDTGMDKGALFTSTAIASIVATLIMSLYANYPFALAPGMGLNAFFTYSVVLGMSKSYEFALTAVLIEGIIFILLTFIKVREAIVNAIPLTLKHAVGVGIGLFIAFLGFINAKLVINNDATLVGLGSVRDPNVIVAIIGLIATAVLLAKNVKGAMLIGIVVGTLVGVPLGVTPLPNTVFAMPPSVAPIAFKFVGFDQIFTFDMFMVIITFLFVDMFDTIGMLIGTAAKSGMLDKDGKLPRIEKALFADAFGTTLGACLGTSTITTFAESATGVAEGARTGLASLVVGILFILSLFLAPIFTIVPAAATAPALIIVGLFMMSSIIHVNFDDITESFPAFLSIIMMPLTYSIGEGLAFGIMSFAAMKLLTGRRREASPIIYVLAVLFALRLIFMVA
ncbi:MAG: NCS2 family permease [Tissierellales bacterium]